MYYFSLISVKCFQKEFEEIFLLKFEKVSDELGEITSLQTQGQIKRISMTSEVSERAGEVNTK